MKKISEAVFLLIFVVMAAGAVCTVSPCDDVDRKLTDSGKTAMAPVIASQLHARKVEVLESFRLDGWTILYVNSHEADEAFLFYSHDPLRAHYTTIWSGAAAINEEESIRVWALKNAPGIPPKLANCFAWYVTHGRPK